MCNFFRSKRNTLFYQNELISHYGYEAETHSVVTQDGYILTVFRCSKKTTSHKKKAVILQHGLTASSDPYCLYPNQSLGK